MMEEIQGRVSVVVPCFNAARWIRETLASVVSQPWDDLELIAVDDGSTDDTGDIVRLEFPSIQLVTTPNQGASRARNIGTSVASGQFIQYLDADDMLTPGKIREQADRLVASGADVAYGDWQKLSRSAEGFVPGEVISRLMSDRPDLDLFGDFWCPPAAYLFRRTIVDQTDGWNEGLPIIQDARFVLDCALRGARFAYCPGVMAQYRVHGGDSLSRRSAGAFNRDVYTNALEVEAWWREHGGISDDRRRALIKCFGWVARVSAHDGDSEAFDLAVAELERLSPGYVPDTPLRLKMVSKLMGYRRAEDVAAYIRQARRTLSFRSN